MLATELLFVYIYCLVDDAIKAGTLALYACSGGPAERMLKMLRTPAAAPVNTAGAAQDPDFCAFGPVPARHQAKDVESLGRCLTHRDLPGTNRLPRTRDPLLAKEPVMSITAWIVPWPAAGPPALVLAGGRGSQGSVIMAGAALPLDCHLLTGRADTGGRPGWANR